MNSLGYIKDKYICEQSTHMQDLSTSLLGIFDHRFIKTNLTKSGKEQYNEYCNANDNINRPSRSHYIYNNDLGFWIVKIGEIHNEKAAYPESNPQFEAICKVEHTPMKWNYWHFSIRWITNEGYWHELLDSRQNKKLGKKLSHETRSMIAKNAKTDLVKYIDIPKSYYIVS